MSLTENPARPEGEGGKFFICNETDGDDPAAYEWEKKNEGLKIYKIKEIENFLKNAGFLKVNTNRHGEKSWITFSAIK